MRLKYQTLVDLALPLGAAARRFQALTSTVSEVALHSRMAAPLCFDTVFIFDCIHGPASSSTTSGMSCPKLRSI